MHLGSKQMRGMSIGHATTGEALNRLREDDRNADRRKNEARRKLKDQNTCSGK